MKISRKKFVAATATVAVVGAGGAAFAYWTTSGSGEGAGATTAGVENRLTFTQNTLKGMFPGDASQPLNVTVKNVSTESAYVSTVKAYVTTDKEGCTGADFLLDGAPAPSGAANAKALEWIAKDLAAGGSAVASGDIQFNNTGEDQDACKGAAVTVHYLAS